ncbi:MAG TPA: 3-dehydroquinate synthase [Allosphingosinicella sp.]|nr:3-dehydroquinate synthase [Allosphingosinicella sp.]
MTRIEVELGGRGYPVLIGDRLIDRAGELLAPYAGRGHVVIVTDTNVAASQAERLTAALERASWVKSHFTLAVPPGEASKDWRQLQTVVSSLLEQGVERTDHVIALGGGVVGDLTGFAAAILKRGCGYIQVPTSLLAQVDASVGGKTAINTAEGKNLVGAFHQPAAVLIDPSTLDTLPERQLRAGYAEVVKYGLVGDAAFFGWCEAHGDALIAGDPAARLYATEASVRAKAAIIAADERETTGRRALLNFGHTFAHALEAETGFSERLLHGEAVALGMALAFRLSARRGLCPDATTERVAAHLAAAGLPTRLADAGMAGAGRRLLAHMATDKKRAHGRLPFILARGIGAAFVDQSVEPAEVEALLDAESA